MSATEFVMGCICGWCVCCQAAQQVRSAVGGGESRLLPSIRAMSASPNQAATECLMSFILKSRSPLP